MNRATIPHGSGGANPCARVGSEPLVVLGVTGCIGAYKAPDLVRELQRRGLQVQVILTRAAREFVAPGALATVSGKPVLERLFPPEQPDGGDIRHISLTSEAAAFLVAPATAHTIARMALGIADDFLTTFHLAVRAPILVAPAMNTNMLEHVATRNHLETLRRRGIRIINPGAGELACGWLGPGRLAPLAEIVEAVVETVARDPADLVGRRVVVAAGPTREPLDPVRYLGNRSSGKMGFALTERAVARGAEVTLVLGPVETDPPPGCEVVRVETAAAMRDAVVRRRDADAVVMAAAVADFRPTELPEKRKRGSRETLRLELTPNPDILAELGADRSGGPRVLAGFAAETGDPEPEARRKLDTKGADLIMGNRVGRGVGFATDRIEAVLVEAGPDGAIVNRLGERNKRDVADVLWTAVAQRLV